MNNIKPRIAFCFSGQARTLDQTYLFFQKNLFDAAKEQGFDYDIFCAVEDDEDVDKVNLLNPTKVEKIKSCEVEKIIVHKYGNFIKTAFKTRYKWAYYTYEGIINYLQQLYKVSKSIMLCDNFEQYDIIARLRFDTIFINQFNFIRILKDLNWGNTIICNDFDLDMFGIKGTLGKLLKPTRQIQDFFFFGDKISMKTLSNIFDNFQECFKGFEVKKIFRPLYSLTNWLSKLILWVNNYSKFHIRSIPIEFGAYTIFTPEKAYFCYMQYNKINVLRKDITMFIVRKNSKNSLIKLSNKSEYEI